MDHQRCCHQRQIQDFLKGLPKNERIWTEGRTCLERFIPWKGMCVMMFNTQSHEVASVLNNMHQALNGINRGNLLRGVDLKSDVMGHVMFCKQCKWYKDFDCIYYNLPKFDQSNISHSNNIKIILFTSL